jgi:endonuclease/exonuclease/phosphatase family metal-dependent hydrolase
VRVYSLHAETRTSCERRLQQFQAVIDDAQTHQAKTERIVVLGDFNTLTGKDVEATAKLFNNARFETPFSHDEETWRTFIIKLKLDWLWLRGLHPLKHGIDHEIGLSDHWPLWTIVTTK